MWQRLRVSWLTREWAGAPAWTLVLLALIALIVGGIAASTRAAGGTEDNSPPLTTSPTTAPSVDASGDDPVHAVFIGDSYTQGIGVANPDDRWSTLVADELGWVEINLGRGGTGYLVTSDADGCGRAFCPNYSGMIGLAAMEEPDVVIVAGGQNDFGALEEDPASTLGAVAFTFDTLRELLPDARIIAVGPSVPGAATPTVEELNAAVQEAAQRVDGVYVSLIDPDVLAGDGLIAEDGIHANDAGHAAIAARVLAALGG